jgi:hypothetical protein
MLTSACPANTTMITGKCGCTTACSLYDYTSGQDRDFRSFCATILPYITPLRTTSHTWSFILSLNPLANHPNAWNVVGDNCGWIHTQSSKHLGVLLK